MQRFYNKIMIFNSHSLFLCKMFGLKLNIRHYCSILYSEQTLEQIRLVSLHHSTSFQHALVYRVVRA